MKTKTKRIYRSKRSKNRKMNTMRLIICGICLITLEIWGIDALKGINTQTEAKTSQIAEYEATKQIEKIEPEIIREFTAYNVGVPAQTDSSPCIGAFKDNLCHLIATGTNVCATNEYPKGTIIEAEGLGRCVVLDRMNTRYKNRIDWAFEADQIQEAKDFGLKRNIKIKIITE